MLGYVFVYSRSKFRVDESNPLVRFEAGSTYEKAAVVIPPNSEGSVDRGIYAICADAADMAPEIREVEGQNTVDFDIYLIKDKDSWPWLIEPAPSERTALAIHDRVRAAFPSLKDSDLKQFYIARGI